MFRRHVCSFLCFFTFEFLLRPSQEGKKETREGRRDERKLSANQRADEMTHPFRLKILLVYYFHSKSFAGVSLEGQFDFTTHSSETHTHANTQYFLVL